MLARSTVFRYKGRAGDPQQSGRELKARVVLTGRVLLWGETLVIGAELVDVTNGWQLWGERYKRSLTDIFDVQEEIARVIVDKLRVKLSPVDERKLEKRYTDDPEAYQLYLKGLYFLNKWSPDGFRMSEESSPGRREGPELRARVRRHCRYQCGATVHGTGLAQ